MEVVALHRIFARANFSLTSGHSRHLGISAMQNFVERRAGSDRRCTNLGPPAGLNDRRMILQRRILNLGGATVKDWIASGRGFAWGRTRHRGQ
jgi:hypothetical protein